MACLVCNNPIVDKAHIKTRGAGGSDAPFNIMLLCRAHHQEQHMVGLVTFTNKYPKVTKYLLDSGWIMERGKWRHY
jgi:predicted restriction endonuclease